MDNLENITEKEHKSIFNRIKNSKFVRYSALSVGILIGIGGCKNFLLGLKWGVVPTSNVYVSTSTGNDTLGCGDIDNPCASINYMLDNISGSRDNPYSVNVAEGTYNENITMDEFECLYGGWDTTFNVRKPDRFWTIIDGNGSGHVVVGADYTVIDGFIIQGSGQNNAGILYEGNIYDFPRRNSMWITGNAVRFNDIGIKCDGYEKDVSPYIWFNLIFNNSSDGISCISRRFSDVSPSIFWNKVYSNGGNGINCTILPPNEDSQYLTLTSNPSIAYNLIADNGENGILCFVDRTGWGDINGNGEFSGTINGNIISGNDNDGIRCHSLVDNTEGWTDSYTFQGNVNGSLTNNIILGNSNNGISCIATGNVVPDNNNCGFNEIDYGIAMVQPEITNNTIVRNQGDGIYIEGNFVSRSWINSCPGCGDVPPPGHCYEYVESLNYSYPFLRNNIISGNLGYGIKEFEDRVSDPSIVENNDIHGNSLGQYLDEGGTILNTAGEINSLFEASSNIVEDPQFYQVVNGTLKSYTYNPEDNTTKLKFLSPTLIPNVLKRLLINPNVSQTKEFCIIENTRDGVTVLGDATIVALIGGAYKINDYHLDGTSLCIDVGTSNQAPTHDIDGNTRPLDGGFDIGADEYSQRSSYFLPVCSNGIDDDMESGEGNWSHYADQGNDDWAILNFVNANSPVNSWFTGDVKTVKDAFLVSEPFHVDSNSELSFWHTHEFEELLGEFYDGAVIEISYNDGLTWYDLSPYITQGGYTGVIATGYGNPISGRMAWVGGTIGTMTQVKVDLSSFFGIDRRIRFRIACDESQSAHGWYIDDVQITGDCNRVGAMSKFGVGSLVALLLGLGIRTSRKGLESKLF